MISSGNIDFLKNLSPAEKKAYQSYQTKVARSKADKYTPLEERAFLKVQKCKAELLRKKEEWIHYKKASISANESISQSQSAQRKTVEKAGSQAIGVADFYTFGGVTKFGEASEAATKRHFVKAGFKFTEGALRTAVGVPMASGVALLGKCGAKALVRGLGYAVRNPKIIGTVLKALPSVLKAGARLLPQIAKSGAGKIVAGAGGVAASTKAVLTALAKVKNLKEAGSLAVQASTKIAQTAGNAVNALKNQEKVIELSSKGGLGDFGLECADNAQKDARQGHLGSAALNAAFAAGTLAGLGALKYEHIMMTEQHAQFVHEMSQAYTSAKGAIQSGTKELLTSLGKTKEVPTMIAQGAKEIFETAKQVIKNPTQALKQAEESVRNIFSPRLALADGGEIRPSGVLKMEAKGASGSNSAIPELTDDFSNLKNWSDDLPPEERKILQDIGLSPEIPSETIHPDSALALRIRSFNFLKKHFGLEELKDISSAFMGHDNVSLAKKLSLLQTLERVDPSLVPSVTRKIIKETISSPKKPGSVKDRFISSSQTKKLIPLLEKVELQIQRDLGVWRGGDIVESTVNSLRFSSVDDVGRQLEKILRAKTPAGLKAELTEFELKAEYSPNGAENIIAGYKDEPGEFGSSLEKMKLGDRFFKSMNTSDRIRKTLREAGINDSTIDDFLSCLDGLREEESALKTIGGSADVRSYVNSMLKRNKGRLLSLRVFGRLDELKASEKIEAELDSYLGQLMSNPDLLERELPGILAERTPKDLLARVQRLAQGEFIKGAPEILLDPALTQKASFIRTKMTEYGVNFSETDEFCLMGLPKDLIEKILLAVKKTDSTAELGNIKNLILMLGSR